MPTSGGNELILKSGGSAIQWSRRVTLRKIQNSMPRPCADSRALGFIRVADRIIPLPVRGCHFATAIPYA